MAQDNIGKKKWEVDVCINAGEYRETVIVTAVRLEQTGPRSIVADGVGIEFEEDILEIEDLGNGE